MNMPQHHYNRYYYTIILGFNWRSIFKNYLFILILLMYEIVFEFW